MKTRTSVKAGPKPPIHTPEGSDFEYVSFFGPGDAPGQFDDQGHDHGHDHPHEQPGREIVVEPDSQGPGLEGPVAFFSGKGAVEPKPGNAMPLKNIPAGLSVRFEPGEEKEVELVEFGGARIILGHRNMK